jgi:hypothetical protein
MNKPSLHCRFAGGADQTPMNAFSPCQMIYPPTKNTRRAGLTSHAMFTATMTKPPPENITAEIQERAQ